MIIYIHTYTHLNRFAVHQKLTQDCKSTLSIFKKLFPLALSKTPFSTLWSFPGWSHPGQASVANSPYLYLQPRSHLRYQIHIQIFDSSVYGHFIVNLSNIKPVLISLLTPRILFLPVFVP